jgi:uncharacterized membrane protein
MVEKVALLKDPSYTPSCSINPILSCGSVMTTAQAEVFGFPNPLIGVAAFPVVAATGAAVLAGARLPRWWWLSLQAGALFGVVFVHWLFVQSVSEIFRFVESGCWPVAWCHWCGGHVPVESSTDIGSAALAVGSGV